MGEGRSTSGCVASSMQGLIWASVGSAPEGALKAFSQSDSQSVSVVSEVCASVLCRP